MSNQAASRPVAGAPAKAAPGRRPAWRRASYEIATQRHAALMQVAVSGRPSIDQMVSTLHILGIESEWPACDVVLVDLRGLGSRCWYHRAG